VSETYTPEELSQLVLRCVVCTGPVPDARSRRRKDTCSVECYDKLKQWRKHLQATRKCPSCLAPYTEKQRAEFRRWRQAEGSLRVTKGRPPISRERRLEDAIRAALGLICAEFLSLERLYWSESAGKVVGGDGLCAEYEAVIQQCEVALGITKPVDTTPPERDSISASHIEA
jgi:hypothetical protein